MLTTLYWLSSYLTVVVSVYWIHEWLLWCNTIFSVLLGYDPMFNAFKLYAQRTYSQPYTSLFVVMSWTKVLTCRICYCYFCYWLINVLLHWTPKLKINTNTKIAKGLWMNGRLYRRMGILYWHSGDFTLWPVAACDVRSYGLQKQSSNINAGDWTER